MRHRALVLLLLAFLLAACNPLSPEPTPTAAPTPSPTSAPATSTPQPTDTPEATPTVEAITTATESIAAGTAAPALTPDAANSEAESELIQVESDTVEIRGLVPKAHVNQQFI